MSRLIVKNLPNQATVESLKEMFEAKGEVTDVQLKYTKSGKFRNFGFIGFRTEEQAAEAKEYFNGAYFRSMKIDVQICANLGDDKKPRAWSKYAPDSTAYKNLHPNEPNNSDQTQKKQRKLEKNKNKIVELLKLHKNDPVFTEFIEAHVNEKTSWIKEALAKATKEDDGSDADEEAPLAEEVPVSTEGTDNTEKKEKMEKKEKIANKKISDLEYMKTLMKKVSGSELQPSEEKEEATVKKVRNRPLLHIKITNLPYKCKKKDIKDFFKPLVPYSIRLPLGKGKRLAGFCYVGFRTEQELKKALNKNKLFIGSHQVHIQKYEDQKKKLAQEEEENNNKRSKERTTNEESIGESGSIFIRNLPYVVTETELTQLFEKYGPITEMNMPIDPVLRQAKGFATVTFMMPEHAVRAYTELDGTAFCGRMLHLLPAKTEKLNDDDKDDDGLTFKEKKAKKLKNEAKSSHNWNTLFLGANAVADVVASNYNTTKEQLLTDTGKSTSAAVRLALGETQLVAETKKFLENNGVYLDAFNKPSQRRSKTCILVKNLPAGTEKEEIKELFFKHGPLARFLMPDHGITALVDFLEPFEAKKAFTKLAYSQFKSSPLYLEWAPEDVFKKSDQVKDTDIIKSTERVETESGAKENNKVKEDEKLLDTKEEMTTNDVEEPESNTTLFVKNVNFKTTEETLRKHFSECGRVYAATIAKKKDPKNPGQFLSMGYGFVQYYTKEATNEALKNLQCSTLDGKTLELKRSERENANLSNTSKKNSKAIKQNGTKILVRNVPFQANKNELHEIFRAFGEIKTLRLPKKLSPGSDQHRGFAFVDFYSKADAKSAHDALCQSTHLYGRRLVLEWADQTDENEDISALRKRTAENYNAQTPGGKKSKKATVDVDTFVEQN